MDYFDLHCDTLYKATTDNSDFNNSSYHVSLSKCSFIDNYKQMFAIWIPDEYKGEQATDLFLKAASRFKKLQINNEKCNMMIAVENASMLNGNIDNIKLLTDNCVKYVTLTWNGENELGCGALCNGNYGLSQFGKEVVLKLEKAQIAVDVSHASDSLFYDVISIASKPVIATHSNSRSICGSKRNLTDEQFTIIKDMGGIVGLNFYKGFLNNDDQNACIEDLIRHADHFLNIGGEHTLAIGADFDGADMPDDIIDITSIAEIYARFLKEFGAKLTKKIFFDNANMYFTNFDII